MNAVKMAEIEGPVRPECFNGANLITLIAAMADAPA